MEADGIKKHPHHDPPHSRVMHLIHEIARITHEQITRECPEMQRSCRLIMMELAHKDNVTQLDLVRATHLKAPTVSVSLQKMEKDGLVLRKPDEDDLRATRVSLTDKGHETDRLIVSKIQEREREAESCLTDEELLQLRSLLMKILIHLNGGSCFREKN